MIDKDELMSNVGANVARLRKLRNWTQGELAEALGVSYVQINRIENGHNLPSGEMLFSLSDLFGVTTDALRQTPFEAPVEKVAKTA